MNEEFLVKEWWQQNRKKYNVALIIFGFLGFVSYCIVAEILIPAPYFEVTIFSMIPQGIGYLIMMGIANILYSLLMYVDLSLNKMEEDNQLHKVIYYGYFIISCLLPFSISILLIIFYHDGYPQEMMYYHDLP